MKLVDNLQMKSSPTAEGTTRTVIDTDGNIYQGGTVVTATAAEINLIDGSIAGTSVASKALVLGANKNTDILALPVSGLKIGAAAGTAVDTTAAELNVNAGVVAGTVTASKTLVVGANKNLDVLAVADLKLGAGAGTSVTSSAAELNLVDGSIAGTTVASKALVVGANKETDVLALPVSGLKIGAGAGTAVDRTAAEINLLAQGVAAGYKIARGTATPTTASDTIATGLATVVAVIVSFKGAPSLTHMFNYGDIGNQAGAPVAGSFLLKSSKPTGVADVTPINSTTPWSAVDWIAIGT